jgi:hypothetical protein
MTMDTDTRSALTTGPLPPVVFLYVNARRLGDSGGARIPEPLRGQLRAFARAEGYSVDYEIVDSGWNDSAICGMFPLLTLHADHIVIITPSLAHLHGDIDRARTRRVRLEESGSRVVVMNMHRHTRPDPKDRRARVSRQPTTGAAYR